MKCFKFGVICNFALFAMLPMKSFSQDDLNLQNIVKKQSAFSDIMLNENTTLINEKQLYLLQARQSEQLQDNSLTIGAKIITLLDYQESNEADKFGWLMRHPTPSNQVGKEVSEAVVHSVQFGVTGTVLPWISVHFNFLYNPEQSFGTGTITSLERNELSVRKAYITFGDLDASAFNFTIGKFEAPFGLTDSVNPFSSSVVWHAFGGLAYGAKLNYYRQGLSISAEAVQGGAQFRALNTPVNNTNVPSKLNNFVVDAHYTINSDNKVYNDSTLQKNLLLGASYEHGSAYCQDFPVFHFEACKDNNPAFAVYSKLNYHQFQALAEFAKTTRHWPGTRNPNLPFPSEKVTAADLGVKYHIDQAVYQQPIDVSFSFGRFIAGDSASPWHKQDQWVVGLATSFNRTAKLFLEGIRVEGYVPLNGISGSTAAATTTISSQSTHNNIIVLGADVAF